MAEPTTEVLATYRDAKAARAAINALERHGVDAEHIRLLGADGVREPKTDDAQRQADMLTTRAVGTRGFGTAVITALVAAAMAGAVAWLVTDGDGGMALLAAVGFFMAGGALGFFYGGATSLAVSGEWGETFEARGGPATLAVHVPPQDVEDMVQTLRKTEPTDLMVA